MKYFIITPVLLVLGALLLFAAAPEGSVVSVCNAQFRPDKAAELRKARKLLEAGELDKAEALLKQLAEQFPDDAKIPEMLAGLPDLRRAQDVELFRKAAKARKARKYSDALDLLRQISSEFSRRDEVDQLITEIEMAELKAIARAENARYRALFRKIKGQDKVQIAPLKITKQKVSTRQEWHFDRAGKSKVHLAAESGKSYVVVDYEISSSSDDPVLPPLAAYYVDGSRAYIIGGFTTAFYQWSDFDAYLGKYEDDANAFADNRAVRFTSAIQIDKKVLRERAIFVVVSRKACLHRRVREDGSPPVFYESRLCTLASECAPEELLERFEVLAVLNSKKL